MGRRTGKDYVFITGLVLCLLAWICLLVAFTTPYWVVSWPRIHSGFKRIGLWEACFAGLILPREPTMKSYHGCWWVLAPEYWKIQSYIMPWWFVICQILVTVCLLVEFVALILQLLLYGDSSRQSQKFSRVQAVTWITVATAIAMVVTVVLFACGFYLDRMWMPRPDLNYLSWSYGMAIMSAFFSIFGSMAHGVNNRITRQERREEPRLDRVPGLHTPMSAAFRDMKT